MASPERRWRLIGVITLVILFVVAIAAALRDARDPAVRLLVTGTAGAKYRGTIEVDGVRQEITGQIPAELHFRSSRLAYALKVDGLPSDEIDIRKYVNGQMCGGRGGKGGAAGGLVVLESGPLLFGRFPVGRVEARWWDAGIRFEDRDKEIILSPDAGKIIWAPREPRAPERE